MPFYEMSFFKMPFYEMSQPQRYFLSSLRSGNPVPVRWIPSCTIHPYIVLIHRLQDPGLQVLRHGVILRVVKFTLVYRFRTPVPDLYSRYRLNIEIYSKLISFVNEIKIFSSDVFKYLHIYFSCC